MQNKQLTSRAAKRSPRRFVTGTGRSRTSPPLTARETADPYSRRRSRPGRWTGDAWDRKQARLRLPAGAVPPRVVRRARAPRPPHPPLRSPGPPWRNRRAAGNRCVIWRVWVGHVCVCARVTFLITILPAPLRLLGCQDLVTSSLERSNTWTAMPKNMHMMSVKLPNPTTNFNFETNNNKEIIYRAYLTKKVIFGE